MRKEEEILTDIEDRQSRMNYCDSQVKEKEAELAQLKESNAQLVAKAVGKQRLPSSLKVQRSDCVRLASEIDELTRARELLGDGLANLKQEQELVVIYYDHISQYKETDENFLKSATEINAFIEDFDEKIIRFNELVNDFTNNRLPSQSLEVILHKLSGRVSLPAFFDKGEVREPDAQENDNWLNSVVNNHNERARIPKKLTANSQELWDRLRDYLIWANGRLDHVRTKFQAPSKKVSAGPVIERKTIPAITRKHVTPSPFIQDQDITLKRAREIAATQAKEREVKGRAKKHPPALTRKIIPENRSGVVH